MFFIYIYIHLMQILLSMYRLTHTHTCWQCFQYVTEVVCAQERGKSSRFSSIAVSASVNLIINISSAASSLARSLLSPSSWVFCFNIQTKTKTKLRFSSSSLFGEGFVAWFHNIWHTIRTRAAYEAFGAFLSSLKSETMFSIVFMCGIKHKNQSGGRDYVWIPTIKYITDHNTFYPNNEQRNVSLKLAILLCAKERLDGLNIHICTVWETHTERDPCQMGTFDRA